MHRYQLMLSCWCYKASNRPNFSKIVVRMSEILTMVSDYLNFNITVIPSAVSLQHMENGEGLNQTTRYLVLVTGQARPK